MMVLQSVKLIATRRLLVFFRPCCAQARSLSSCGTLKQTHHPLRVLFCGADEFSIYSLRALNDLRLDQPEKVASIDVVCRTDKRVGRGLKRVQAGIDRLFL